MASAKTFKTIFAADRSPIIPDRIAITAGAVFASLADGSVVRFSR